MLGGPEGDARDSVLVVKVGMSRWEDQTWFGFGQVCWRAARWLSVLVRAFRYVAMARRFVILVGEV